MPAPPRTLDDLLRRASGLAGLTLGQIAALHEVEVPPDLRRQKGWVGQLLETCLGTTAGNAPRPDFLELGVELKTLPMDRHGKPRESTYVARVPLTQCHEQTWERSAVRQKLRCVLWVPIHAAAGLPLAERLVGQAFLWEPTAAEERLLRDDWEAHLARIRRGEVDSISARDGEVLQIRPKAANRHESTWAEGDLEEVIRTGPRGFYLRTRFTAALVRRYFFGDPPERAR